MRSRQLEVKFQSDLLDKVFTLACSQLDINLLIEKSFGRRSFLLLLLRHRLTIGTTVRDHGRRSLTEAALGIPGDAWTASLLRILLEQQRDLGVLLVRKVVCGLRAAVVARLPVVNTLRSVAALPFALRGRRAHLRDVHRHVRLLVFLRKIILSGNLV